jgi:hypothetical protein
MVEDDDRVVALDRRLDEPEGLVRRRREHDPHAPSVQEERRRHLRMLGGVGTGRTCRADDYQGNRELSAGHVAEPPGLVDDLVEGDVRKAREHDVDHRPKAPHGRADGSANEGRLRDRAVDNALAPEFVGEAASWTHDSDRHVLAPDDHSRISAHALGDPVCECGREPFRSRPRLDLGHAKTSSNARSTGGSGSA